jgi:hypothetical protein
MSDAQGATTADFAAEVSSSATGGAGGRLTNPQGIDFAGGNGGDAFATATGSNNGLSAVTVSSSASGGAAYLGFLGGTDGVSGDATAMSTPSDSARIRTATATGNFFGGDGGAALARERHRPERNATAAAIPVGAFSLPSGFRGGACRQPECRITARVGSAPTLAMAAGFKGCVCDRSAFRRVNATASVVQGASYRATIPVYRRHSTPVSLILQIAMVGNLRVS